MGVHVGWTWPCGSLGKQQLTLALPLHPTAPPCPEGTWSRSTLERAVLRSPRRTWGPEDLVTVFLSVFSPHTFWVEPSLPRKGASLSPLPSLLLCPQGPGFLQEGGQPLADCCLNSDQQAFCLNRGKTQALLTLSLQRGRTCSDSGTPSAGEVSKGQRVRSGPCQRRLDSLNLSKAVLSRGRAVCVGI